jgi:hypothetical protein
LADPTSNPVRAARRYRRRRQRRTDELRIASSGLWVRPSLFLDRPLVSALMGEDTAWQFAVTSWSGRQPRWWRFGSRRAWSQEGQALESKRRRLCGEALLLGLSARGVGIG